MRRAIDCAVRSALTFLLCAYPLIALTKEKPAPAPKASRSQQLLGEPDLGKEFHIQQLTPYGRANSFNTKNARTDTFYFQQKFKPKGYEARDFKTKGWWAGDFKFSTSDANTKGKYVIPNASKAVDSKTSPTKDARESAKTAATKDLRDGNRPYLGREAQKMAKPLDPTNLPKITNEMHELKTVEDIKALLNKN